MNDYSPISQNLRITIVHVNFLLYPLNLPMDDKNFVSHFYEPSLETKTKKN